MFLTYASRFGQALIDRRLYLPEAWAGDAARRSKVSVPAETTFATKPAIARDLITAALDAGAPCAFVLADAPYGSDSQLRRMLEARRQPYVLAVRSNHHLRFLEPRDARHGGRRLPGPPRGRSPPDHLGHPSARVDVIRQSERNESKRSGRVTWVVALLPSTTEIRALLARLVFRPPIRISYALRWSLWRRRHQAQATRCRYLLHHNL